MHKATGSLKFTTNNVFQFYGQTEVGNVVSFLGTFEPSFGVPLDVLGELRYDDITKLIGPRQFEGHVGDKDVEINLLGPGLPLTFVAQLIYSIGTSTQVYGQGRGDKLTLAQ